MATSLPADIKVDAACVVIAMHCVSSNRRCPHDHVVCFAGSEQQQRPSGGAPWHTKGVAATRHRFRGTIVHKLLSLSDT